MSTLSGQKIQGYELRKLGMDQAEAFYAHIDANRQHYIDTIPFVSKVPDLTALRERLSQNLLRQEQGLADFYVLWSETRIEGYFLVREKDLEARWAEIGYMIDKGLQGKGITFGICELMIADLFENQAMQKVVICCNDDNFGSMAVARKLGFTQEGNIRSHFVVNGKLRNMMYFGLLKDEWLAARTTR